MGACEKKSRQKGKTKSQNWNDKCKLTTKPKGISAQQKESLVTSMQVPPQSI